MGQEFIIKSQQIEDKINQLLPSQGGFAPGVDFSASTTVIPIVDLTETAEGSSLRQDLQTSLDINVSEFDIRNASNSTIINTTGYYRFIGNLSNADTGSGVRPSLQITDGTTTKKLINTGTASIQTAVGLIAPIFFDFIVKVAAGESVTGTAASNDVRIVGVAKQIADINGNLT